MNESQGPDRQNIEEQIREALASYSPEMALNLFKVGEYFVLGPAHEDSRKEEIEDFLTRMDKRYGGMLARLADG